MFNTIGIRRETKDETQRRAPLAPEQVGRLVRDHDLKVLIQPWGSRTFADNEYLEAGAILSDDLRKCNIVFGVKEIYNPHLADGAVYCCFSHTVKGQRYNMPMLREILDRRISLFDYEMVKDAEDRRLTFFGPYAGYAGMIDTFWALGRRLETENIPNPFSAIRYATGYDRLEDAKAAMRETGEKIRREGLPNSLVPFICGFTGYGNVSKAAQEIYDLLPVETIGPGDLEDFIRGGKFSANILYKTEFRKPDLYTDGATFDLKKFNRDPSSFRSGFADYLPHLTLMVNGIYWEPGYPRLVTVADVKKIYGGQSAPRLRVIGDITCDIGGSVEVTVRESTSQNPVYVFDPRTGTATDGVTGTGPVILAVDKLPTELPKEATRSFGAALERFVPRLAKADFTKPVGKLDIPPEFRRALIAHGGALAPGFEYLDTFLRAGGLPARRSKDS